MYFFTLQRTRVNEYFYSIKFGYHFSWNWMSCDNLPRLQGKLSQVTFLYKVVSNNCNVTIEGNPTLFNCSQGFTQNFAISQPSWILNAKNTKILKQNVWQLAPVYPTLCKFFCISGTLDFIRICVKFLKESKIFNWNLLSAGWILRNYWNLHYWNLNWQMDSYFSNKSAEIFNRVHGNCKYFVIFKYQRQINLKNLRVWLFKHAWLES